MKMHRLRVVIAGFPLTAIFLRRLHVACTVIKEGLRKPSNSIICKKDNFCQQRVKFSSATLRMDPCKGLQWFDTTKSTK